MITWKSLFRSISQNAEQREKKTDYDETNVIYEEELKNI